MANEERIQVHTLVIDIEDTDGLSLCFDLRGSFTQNISNDGDLENRSDYGTIQFCSVPKAIPRFPLPVCFFCFLQWIHWAIDFFSKVSFWHSRFCFTSP